MHLNFPLREPLVSDEELPADRTGRHEGRPYVTRAPGRLAAPESMVTLYELAAASTRGIIVAGRDERAGRPQIGPTDPRSAGEAAAAFAAAWGWPVLADPLSGARRGGAAIAHYDALLRDHAFAAGMRPDLVIRVGDLPTSKPLRAWLAGLDDARQVALDPECSWQDPGAALSRDLPSLDPAATLTRSWRTPPPRARMIGSRLAQRR